MISIKLIFVALVLGIIGGTLGHSYVTSPTSRSNQKETSTGCRGPSCLGPCDKPASQARTPITVARGQSISIQWPRNNHAGGFIRIAWAQTSQSDSHAAFDANVQEVSCHERGGCKPDSASDPNGGDSGPLDGSVNPCTLSVTVPSHLTDGLWTMQWAWFGGAFALGDYYSCVDYKISGGASGAKADAFFVGGDYTYPGQQKCKFFNTDRLHQCVNEPCNNPVYALNAERSGTPFGIATTSSPPPSTPSTTGKTQPMTTGKTNTPTPPSTPSTTGKTQTITTGISVPSTTGIASTPTSELMCYKEGTPMINGRVNLNSGKCGKNDKRARCPEGQCCSRYGYCGASAAYCENAYADYRKYTCASLGMTESNADGEKVDVVNDDDIIEASFAVKNISFGVLAIALVALLF